MTNVRGTVTDAGTGKPIGGVLVKIGSRSGSTNRKGVYSIYFVSTGLQAFSCTKTGYRRVDMAVTIGPGVKTIDVTMQLITGTLSGKVISSDFPNGLAGVTVTLGTTTTTTDASGNYGIAGIPPGSYPLSFAKAGYTTVNM